VGEFAGRDAGLARHGGGQIDRDDYSIATTNRHRAVGGRMTARRPVEVLVEREAVRPRQGIDDLRQARRGRVAVSFRIALDAANLSRLRRVYLLRYAPVGRRWPRRALAAHRDPAV